MAGQDDDFGDFSSAFPTVNSLAGYQNASTSLGNDATGTGTHKGSNEIDKFNTFAVPNQTGDSCPVNKFSQLSDGNMTFDAFASCPVSVDPSGFADFSQFNIADFPIPNPGESEVQPSDFFTTACGSVFEIPPLPDDLDFDVGNDGISLQLNQVQVSMNGETETLPHTTMASSDTTVNSLGVTTSGESEQLPRTKPSTADLDKPTPRTEDVSHDNSSEFGDFETSFKQSEEDSLTLDRLQSSGTGRTERDQNSAVHTTSEKSGVNFGAFVGMETTHSEGGLTAGPTQSQSGRKSTVSESLSDDFGEFFASGTDKDGAVINEENHKHVEYQQPRQEDVENSPGFGEFSAFQQAGFGQFGEAGINVPTQDGEEQKEEGTFSVSSSDDKRLGGDFGTSESGGSASEFAADFSKFQSSEPGTEVTQIAKVESSGRVSDFGEFATFSTDDDFGDFSSSTTATFGDFTQPPAVSSVSTMPPPTPSISNHSKVSGDVLGVCFPSEGGHTSSLATPVAQLHPKEESPESVWDCLQRCVDFTVPLYKWEKSYMQDHYYGALKIDTSLVGPGALPIFASSMAPFDLNLEGLSAVDDLMDAFGFETGLEPTKATTPQYSSSEFTLNSEETAPALLDLSLPSSPSAETERASITSGLIATDLLGLDLNPKASQQLTSIQQLLLNERLVVNRSTWMDSQLLELEGDHPPPTSSLPHPSSSNSSTPSIPRQSSVEQQLLQLGLDVRKTTFAAASTTQKELSLSARTVLGQLPDLSFMFSETIVERKRR